MNKEEINKLIDKKIKGKGDKQSIYNLFFIAYTIFFASLIQLVIYYYSNTEFVVPLSSKLVILLVLGISMLILYFLLIDLLDRLKIKKGKLIHNLLPLSLALIIFLIVMFVLYESPKSNLLYSFNCPDILESGSNISLFVENKGRTTSSYQFYSYSTERLSFAFSKQINKTAPEHLRISPNEVDNLKFGAYFHTRQNVTNITITNFFDCYPKSSIDCILTTALVNEDSCTYIKEDNKYKKKIKTILVQLG